MSFLENFVETSLASSIGWTLLHSLWEGTILAGSLATVLVMTRSPRARYAAACTAMVAMLAGFGLTLIWMLPEGVHGFQSLRASALPAWNVLNEKAASRPWNLSLSATVPWIAPFWITGVWFIFLSRLGSCVSVQKLRKRGVCSPSVYWEKELSHLSAQLHLSRPIQFLESSLADVPMVLGHFRPLILMPIGLLANLPAEQIEAILLHELAHIRRCDYLVNVLQRWVECLLFYHPAVWWISRVIRTERENCCDDVVVSIIGSAYEYALALTAMEKNRLSGCEPAIAVTGGGLMQRIRRLLYPKASNGAWVSWLAAATFAATCTICLTAFQAKPSPNGSLAVPAMLSMSAQSSDAGWLSGPVSYIIEPRERTAFKKLASEAERDKFIEQFWERRNPHPGSPENKYKEEFDRRVAFANKHFACARPGWQTDRGHMYIVHGPPDEIEMHPAGTGNMPPYAEWSYYHVQGIGDNVTFEFIDQARNGDYHLVPGNARYTPEKAR